MINLETIKEQLGVKSIFTQNSKMKRSSSEGVHLYNFGIPAFQSSTGVKTCPNAKACIAGCYARSGTYQFSNVAKAFEARLQLTQNKEFSSIIKKEINKLLKKHKTGLVLIRVHDSGDFYSKSYQASWYDVAREYLNEPRIKFYAYTKMVSQSLSLEANKPNNFKILFSYGGKEDNLIKPELHYHSKVFETAIELSKSGYIDGTHDDTIAALDLNNKVGLVYHGTKKYSNTTWGKV